MKKQTSFLLAVILLIATSCSRTPNIGGSWKMGGDANKHCEIVQKGKVLIFVNENGDKSNGSFKDKATVIAIDWAGVNGVVSDDATRINWNNGTWWSK